MPFAFISPYESLRAEAQRIIDAENLPGLAYLGKGEAGVVAAREALRDGARILISRGMTAKHIERTLGIELIELKGSALHITAFIHQKTTPKTRIALAGSRRIIELAAPVCEAMERPYAAFAVESLAEVQSVYDQVRKWAPDAAIGDAEMARRFMPAGLPVHLVESTTETLREAFDQAMMFLANLRHHNRSEKNLAAVLNCVQEGAMLVNADGLIEEINVQGCGILRTDRRTAIGSHYRTIIPSEEISSALKAGKSLRNCLLTLNGRRMVANLSNASIESGVDSAVILFQPIDEMQKVEVSTRRKLFQKGLFARYTFDDIRHRSEAMRRTVAVAREYGGTDSNILIQGESGTGKELFAQSIHNASPLSQGPFVAVNCAALPGTLLESELFGYAPGAFTGARPAGKPGLFELAHRGTLFLDEIGEMEVRLQARLLRAIQEQEIMRLGDDQVIPVSVRIIAASNQPLDEAVRSGTFRTDLFFRLNVLDLHIPPLRERENDASFLFLDFLRQRNRAGSPEPTPEFLQALDRAPWPGNIRELENFAEKYVALRGALEAPRGEDVSAAAPAREETMDTIIARNVRDVLVQEDGNIARAAARLGLSRNTVKRWRDWRRN